MSNALVGFSGFVGSTLLKQATFESLYRSTNIGEIAGQQFDTVVCAGAPAQKWIANREPEADRQKIEGLIAHLKAMTCKTFVLISTVDVFKDSFPCLIMSIKNRISDNPAIIITKTSLLNSSTSLVNGKNQSGSKKMPMPNTHRITLCIQLRESSVACAVAFRHRINHRNFHLWTNYIATRLICKRGCGWFGSWFRGWLRGGR